jgi:hypothetical protein
MARAFGRILASIWDDEDFLDLTVEEQRLYMFLLSQSNLNHAGLLPLTLKRWSRKAKKLTSTQLEEQLEALEAARFVVLDYDTEELLVRTLVRNDAVYKQPRVMGAMVADAKEIASRKLRNALLSEIDRLPLDELLDTPGPKKTPSIRAQVTAHVADLRAAFGAPKPVGQPHWDPLDELPAEDLPEPPDEDPREDLDEGDSEEDPQGDPQASTRVGASPRARAYPLPLPLSPTPEIIPTPTPNPLGPKSGGGGGGGDFDEATALLATLEPEYLRPPDNHRATKLREAVAGLLAAGVSPDVIRLDLQVNPLPREEIKSVPAYLDGRLKSAASYLAVADRTERVASGTPPWCGTCDQASRQLETDDGDSYRCPDCHPATAGKAAKP